MSKKTYWISYGNDGEWLTAEEMIREIFHFQPPLPTPDRKYFYEDVLFLMEAYHNQFKQPQPTAGGVKEEVKICKGCGVDWNISKKCWCLIPTFDQPSPSNPSIKRPTEEEIDKAAKAYNPISEVNRLKFKAGVNWLLSIQSDK